MKKNNNKKQILEGSQAIAQVINNIQPDVISAYPITPQTHIVEDLAKLKADGKATYEYIRAESEFAAASIVTGASAAGSRTYTATSSQGILLMCEVLFNIAGMRLPIVLTCANRGVSAPITIWNDHQDAMTVRDAGWIQLFAENHQEAIEQHLLAYKIAESVKLPVMVNIDGFVLTHTYEDVYIPTPAEIKKFLPKYKPAKGDYLDVKKPASFGAFATPAHYQEIREELYNSIIDSQENILNEYEKLKVRIPNAIKRPEKASQINNGLIEYYGPKNPKTVLIAMGSLVGTIKDVVDNNDEKKKYKFPNTVGVLKIKSYRPFPAKEVAKITKKAKFVAVLEKAISLGASEGPLALDVKSATYNEVTGVTINGKTKIQNFIVGLGGRDITKDLIADIINDVQKKNSNIKFV